MFITLILWLNYFIFVFLNLQLNLNFHLPSLKEFRSINIHFIFFFFSSLTETEENRIFKDHNFPITNIYRPFAIFVIETPPWLACKAASSPTACPQETGRNYDLWLPRKAWSKYCISETSLAEIGFFCCFIKTRMFGESGIA